MFGFFEYFTKGCGCVIGIVVALIIIGVIAGLAGSCASLF